LVLKTSFVLLALVVSFMFACSDQQAPDSAATEEALEVEDVSLPVDSGLSTETDVKGPPIVQGVSGVLPSDYPRGLPTHEPSSVSDIGDRPDGGRFVEFESPTGAATVAAGLESRLRRAGWHLETTGPGRFRAAKDGVQVDLEVSDLFSGSRIRVEYR
jgi:hypothetical protein